MGLLQNHIKSKFIPPPPFHKAMTIRAPGVVPPPPPFIPAKKAKTQQEILDLLKGSIYRKMVPPPPFHKSMAAAKPVHIPPLPGWN